MDIEIVDENEHELTFTMTDTSPAFANALRRTMIATVPTLAIEDVYITENSSGIFDEALSHRLGLIPWTFDPDTLRFPEDCDCDDGCTKCTVHMAVQQEGPGPVTAADVSIPADDVKPIRPDTVIADLVEDAVIELEATAHLGTGQEHAKWQSANAAYAIEDDDTFRFTVESVSGLDPRTIVSQAVDQLSAELDAFEEAAQE